MRDTSGTRLPRRPIVALCSAALLLSGATGVVPHGQDAQALVTGQRIERALTADETHRYQVTLHAGDYLLVRVDKIGLEIVATVAGPDGREFLQVQADADPFEPEFVALITETDGDVVLSIRQPKGTKNAGRYAVSIEDARPAVPEDRVRIDAERALTRSNRLAALNRSAQDLTVALEDATSALESFRKLGLRQRELGALLDVINVQLLLNRPPSMDEVRQAERLAHEINDVPAQALVTNMLGGLAERAGDLETARAHYVEAAAIAHSIGSTRSEAMFLMNEGAAYGRTGDSAQAITRFERALELIKQSDYQSMQAGLLNNLGIAYKNLGLFDKSLEAYRTALAIHREGSQIARQVLILNNMGNVEGLLGRHDQALADHLHALELSRQIGSAENEARSLNTIGQTYYVLGDFAKALDYHRQALEIRRRIEDLIGQGASLDGLGRALGRLGDREGALKALDESLAIRRRIQDRGGQLDTLRDLASIKRDQGRLAAAVDDIRAAVDLEEDMRSRVTSPELRTSFGAFQHDKYELFVDLLEERQRAEPTAQFDKEALGVAERGRARVLLESLLDARVDFRQGAEQELVDRERSLQRQLNGASSQLSRLLTAKGREDQAAAAARTVEDLTHRYDELQAEIRRTNPRYADVTQPRSLTAAEIQNDVLDPDTVLLEFAPGEGRSWLWTATTTSVKSVELPPRAAIDTAARRLYEALRVPSTTRAYTNAAAMLSDMLLGPVARLVNDEWRGKRLAVVAPGSLEYVPFAALPRPVDRSTDPSHRLRPSNRAILASDHEIVSLPSASVVAALRRESGAQKPPAGRIAILADPVFEADDPRVMRSGPVTHHEVDPAAPRLAAGIRLGRLPFTREEAATIATLAGTTGVMKATDFNASRATVMNGALNQYRIVHFATHGVIDSEHPALTGLVLSLVDRHGAAQDGYLRIHDIYAMRLNADLVVLSACQTALGKEIKGEGLVGLTRAFMYAGAPSVVASLWQVNDRATAELMKRFYAGMLRRHLRAPAALRAAQIEMSHDPRWAHPYYWAGFIVQGDWR